jgi:carboxymethylenebutenolidase
MASFWESTKVDDEDMRLHVSVPEGSGIFPAVVVIHHHWALDGFTQDITQRLAQAGYAGIAPDMFHRAGTDYEPGPARAAEYQDANIIKDVNATLGFLKNHPSVDNTRLGIVGFCSGGRITYLMASASPDFKAAAAYYPGHTMEAWGDGKSPFDLTSEIHCPVLVFCGDDDANPSPADRAKIDAELDRHGKVHESYSYPGAEHAFMNQVTERNNRYRHEAAQDAWAKTIAFFDRHVAKVAVTSG